MEIMPDHVHMLLEVDPQFGIHKVVKSFKGYTSRILRQEFPYLKTKMPTPVSYTHLDVYKRQVLGDSLTRCKLFTICVSC